MQSVEPQENSPPKNKGGRPKGKKNRPKWLLKELKALPKRPRGRPKGSKGKPKTLEAWFENQLLPSLKEKQPPLKQERKKRKPPSAKPKFSLADFPPEKRIEVAKKARATQIANNISVRRYSGKPENWTNKDYLRFLDEAKRETARIFKIMDKNGLTPDNEMAKVALQSAFDMIADPLSPRDRLAAVRTVLEYTKQKPATQQNVTVKTAEDFLDELEKYDSNTDGGAEAPSP